MRPLNPIHPGRMLLEEFLEPAAVSQRAFAKRLGWTNAKLNELINGRRGITADSALDIAACDRSRTAPACVPRSGSSLSRLARILPNTASSRCLDPDLMPRRRVARDFCHRLLADELGTSPEVWLNLQMQFDLRRAELKRKPAS